MLCMCVNGDCVSELTSLNTDNVEDDDSEDIAGSSTGLYHVIKSTCVACNIVTQCSHRTESLESCTQPLRCIFHVHSG